jgi:hypothetical protein
MPMITLTAAEIAAAEAAAIAAAEAAAIQAAQVAAAEAAAQAAATAAAEQAAAQAATQAATQQATTSGIQTLAQEVAASPPTGIDQLTQAFQNAQVNNVPMSQAEFLNQSFAGPAVNTGSQLTPLTPTPVAITPMAPPAVPVAPTLPPVPAAPAPFNAAQPFANPAYATAPPTPPASLAPTDAMMNSGNLDFQAHQALANPPVDYGRMNTQGINAPADLSDPYKLYSDPSKYSVGSPAANYNLAQSVPSPAATATANPEPSGIGSLFNKGLDYVKQNPLTSLMGANTAYNALNKPELEEKKKYKSTFNRNMYQAYNPVQPTPYQPQYAGGGLADLGGYSDGGRMLKGPGDGMSDDIPATIANKQPARLANEEFVIPADVVSHLGNGSSEAGAKQLYKMMERVRKARTGNKKQGKQINPEKYLA